MSKKCCPNCHTQSGLTPHKSLLLSFENWPLVILYGLVVLAFAEKYHYQTTETSVFISLAVVPLLFKFIRKISCDYCGIEFREETNEARGPVQVSDLRP